MTESQRADLEAWIVRAQESLKADQPKVARIQLAKVLQLLYQVESKPCLDVI